MKLKIFLYLIIVNILLCQPIPKDFIGFYKKKLMIDSGKNWFQNSIFGPPRMNNKQDMTDSLIIISRLGLKTLSNGKSFYGFGNFTYNKYFHGYLYSRIVNHPELFERFSGIQRDINRFGFTAGETDQSGICFENNWLTFQFGRGRESWGAGNDIQLGLYENSNPYDYGMLDLDFGKLKVRYFNGYLETDSLEISRYISGRGIEWNNEKNILLGLSEVVVYSGKNRTLDFSYLNPISTHLEIELNDKQNNLGTDNGNGIWQVSIDYLFLCRFKISFNYLMDEIVLDKVQKNANKSSQGGFSFKIVHSPSFFKGDNSSNIYASFVKISTNTFRHEDGNNNFVVRDKPLGWPHGSDGREFKLGFDSFTSKYNLLVRTCFGRRDLGSNSIIESPYNGYTNYISVPFPSGNYQKVIFFQSDLQWWYKPYISLRVKMEHYKTKNQLISGNFKTGIDIYFPVAAKI